MQSVLPSTLATEKISASGDKKMLGEAGLRSRGQYLPDGAKASRTKRKQTSI